MHESFPGISVLVVDDHPVVRRGLQSMLLGRPEVNRVEVVDNGRAALALISSVQPQLVLLDMRMPGLDGVQTVRRLKSFYPTLRVIILSNYADDHYVLGAVRAGADGYLLKTASEDELFAAIKAAMAGRSTVSLEVTPVITRGYQALARDIAQPTDGLTTAEQRVLALVAHGATNREIARSEGISEAGVKKRLQSVYRKLEVNDRAQAVAEGLRRGLI